MAQDWLGTILPTAETLAAAERLNAKAVARAERIALTSPELRGCTRRVVGGEVRYYDTTDQYAIISRQGKILWFAVTPDGDFRISR